MEQVVSMPRIGDPAPAFEAQTTRHLKRLCNYKPWLQRGFAEV